jgi:hypothetical protein
VQKRVGLSAKVLAKPKATTSIPFAKKTGKKTHSQTPRNQRPIAVLKNKLKKHKNKFG